MNVNLPRWIMASMADHFSTVAGTIPIQYFVEGVDEELAVDFQSDSALFRLDGPTAYQSASGEEWYKVEIQILLTDLIERTNDNGYDIHRWAGVFQGEMLNGTLPIFRYGTGGEDDDSLVGCLEPDTSVRNNIRVAHYGIIDRDIRIRQSSVNGKFILCPK